MNLDYLENFSAVGGIEDWTTFYCDLCNVELAVTEKRITLKTMVQVAIQHWKAVHNG